MQAVQATYTQLLGAVDELLLGDPDSLEPEVREALQDLSRQLRVDQGVELVRLLVNLRERTVNR